MSSRQQFKGEAPYGYSSETDHLVEFNKSSPETEPKRKSCLCYGSVALLVTLIVIIVLGTAIGLGLNFGLQSKTLPSRMTTSNLMSHLQELDKIGKSHPAKSRAVQYGYNESAEMVYERLKEAGFEDVTRQYFTVATYEENTDGSSLSASFESNDQEFNFNFLRDSQYSVMRYSQTTGGEKITGNLSIVTEMCNSDNYTEGTVAIIDYIINEEQAGCNLVNMTQAAADAGVLALIMMRTEGSQNNDIPPTTRIYYQGETFLVSELPVIGATYQLGSQLKNYIGLSDKGLVEISLSTDTTVEFWGTYNILAYTSNHKRDNAIIVVGSHLDSVPAGAGINDNGSGTAANLEMAIQIIKHASPINKVLFAFWGAEELGLLGSKYFVNSLDEENRNDIALNLNFDMIASPNYKRMVYNGSGAENQNIIAASGQIQRLFVDYFESRELNYSLTGFNGRSDYGPFIAEGVDIPAGGLATGSNAVKSEEDRQKFGGLANTILDPCYHQACDTIDNIDQEVHLEMTQAAAYVLNELMMEENLKDFLLNG